MKILLLAPHPFYQDRGTPIAVDLLLRVLSSRGEIVDVVTYHVGDPVAYDRVYIHRIANIPFIHKIRPGFSWQKMVCDFFVFFKSLGLLIRGNYQIVHAIEESVFMAILFKKLFRIPFVYDMDSSVAQQMIEKFAFLRVCKSIFDFLEGSAMRQALAVVAVCDALAEIAQKHNKNKVVIFRDVSLLKDLSQNAISNIRAELEIKGLVMMYVGNLEKYQGIDLLLESFRLATQAQHSTDLVIIGGNPTDIKIYQEKAKQLGIAGKIHFLGPRPVNQLSSYLSQADILVSPRIKGVNTPMKIYSYLHSGRPVLATDILSHSQLMTPDVALLAPPQKEIFSQAMLTLINDPEKRTNLGEAGQDLIEKCYSIEAFNTTANEFYNWVGANLAN